jgi:hypothetical protein
MGYLGHVLGMDFGVLASCTFTSFEPLHFLLTIVMEAQ